MEYKGKYKIFDSTKINTYPLSQRTNKVKLADIVDPNSVNESLLDVPQHVKKNIEKVAKAIVSARSKNKPVVFFSGAHLIKNGLSRFVIELVKNDIITLVAGNAATAIHDFELALIGETSEYVPHALGKGQFGMAYEFGYINTAISKGNQYKLGFGESLGKMICNDEFRCEILSIIARENSPKQFLHSEISLLAVCYQHNVPFTVHAGIGTDVIDQHASFDGQAKGGCSGRDFLIYTNEISKFTNGGVILNIGSAVTGPEVLLKAISMATNIGLAFNRITTADFDLRTFVTDQMTNEAAANYYFRDQKSVVTRIPEAVNGTGYYIQGNQKVTIPLLYKNIIEKLQIRAATG